MTLTIRPAEPSDMNYVERLLTLNNLPTGDIHADEVELFVATDDSVQIGAGGLETHGSQGLLRSVVVDEEQRDQRYGTTLTQQLLDKARHQSIDGLYLLTTTARVFFRERGFQPIDRHQVPAVIRATSEFAELCPDSAVCMYRRIE